MKRKVLTAIAAASVLLTGGQQRPSASKSSGPLNSESR